MRVLCVKKNIDNKVSVVSAKEKMIKFLSLKIRFWNLCYNRVFNRMFLWYLCIDGCFFLPFESIKNVEKEMY